MFVVSIVTDGELKWFFTFPSEKKAEKMFVDLIEHEEGNKYSQDEYDEALMDGYWDAGSSVIYIGQGCSRKDFFDE